MTQFTEITELLKELNNINRRSVEEYTNAARKTLAILRGEFNYYCRTCGSGLDEDIGYCDVACSYSHEQDIQENSIATNN